MGSTILFTHLKIILLQCFQFSVFSNNKFNPNTPYINYRKIFCSPKVTQKKQEVHFASTLQFLIVRVFLSTAYNEYYTLFMAFPDTLMFTFYELLYLCGVGAMSWRSAILFDRVERQPEIQQYFFHRADALE